MLALILRIRKMLNVLEPRMLSMAMSLLLFFTESCEVTSSGGEVSAATMESPMAGSYLLFSGKRWCTVH